MNTCGTCKYFGAAVRDDKAPTGYHVCGWIKHYENNYGDETPTADAVVIDGSGYFAALCVKEEFGCNKWEPAAP